ncbi:MAG: hypothetical protein AAF212_01905 [Verrucomicrobiota bacterium]
MKSAIILCVLTLASLTQNLLGQSNSSGPTSPVIPGSVVEVISENEIIVLHESNHRRVKISDKTRVSYNFFQGLGMGKVSKPQPGFAVKVKAKHIDGIDHAKSVQYIPVLPSEMKAIENKTQLSDSALFAAADLNKSGDVDFIEYSQTILNSLKHGVDFFGAADADESGTLNSSEFLAVLQRTTWWKLSRKTPEAWLAEADKNRDSVIDAKEFKLFSKKNRHFTRTDVDSSGSVNLQELEQYLANQTS